MTESRYLRIIAAFLYVLAFCCSTASAQDLNTTARFSIESIQSAMASTKLSKVTVKNDPIYNDARMYEGYPLVLVLKTLAVHLQPTAWIRFSCRDGYAPEIPIKKVLDGSAFLAMRSLHKTAEHGWEPMWKDGKQTSPGPAYLVWTLPDEKPEEFPWPYQIVSIEVFSRQRESIMAPREAGEIASKGFGIFAARCLKCHSLNGYGGEMGPELLDPCSVTQYWTSEFLQAYIRKPQSIRAKARMPSNEDLSDGDLRSVLAYLGYLVNHRKNSASDHCPVP